MQAHRYVDILVELMGVLRGSAEGWIPASIALTMHMRAVGSLKLLCFERITSEAEAALVAYDAATVSFMDCSWQLGK